MMRDFLEHFPVNLQIGVDKHVQGMVHHPFS